MERAAVPGDRRGRVIRLTAKGWDEMAACGRALAEIERIWSEQLGAQRFGQLRLMLADLHQPRPDP